QPIIYERHVAVVLAVSQDSLTTGVKLERTQTLLQDLSIYMAKAGVDVAARRQSLLAEVLKKLQNKAPQEPLEIRL
ncbi:MAG: hypothetical protein Q8L34_03130, partial [Candidatus Woesearchaeota archaeon]|nr:hypothetical protein [Candidatus Woesearchaeota archaeon]